MSNYNLPNREQYKKTSTGLVIFGEIVDRYCSKVTVQESRIAFEPAVHIFTANPAFKDADLSPHLTPKQAKQLIKILQNFVEVSKLEEYDDDPQE